MPDFHSLLILMVVVWVMGKIFRQFHLPVIFGELMGGILVGPLVLNVVQPGDQTITILAELGIFFLMLHAGLENDPEDLLHASRKSILISILGTLLPMGAIYWIARYLGYGFNEALFFGMALSITAVAITVRIFKDYKIHNTKIAHTTLSAAIFSDILGLVLFSLVLNVIEQGQVDFLVLSWLAIKIFLFFFITLFLGLKLSKYSQKFLKNKGFTLALIVALALGFIAEQIGLHLIIGAFLAGLFIREEVLDEKIFNKIEDRIYGLSYSFLGPIFFTSLALHMSFDALLNAPVTLVIILIVSIIAKVFSAGFAAMIQKIPLKQAALVGIAMNSRGAIDLVIASIGLQKGIIDSDILSILVFMIFAGTLFSIFAVKPLAKYAK